MFGSSLLQPNAGPSNNEIIEHKHKTDMDMKVQSLNVPKELKVVLNCLGQKELIKDVPIEYAGDKVLLVPILNHIKYLGKPIARQSISYFSEEDEMDVYVGIEGVNIRPNYAISLDELASNGKQPKLILNVKENPDSSPLIKKTIKDPSSCSPPQENAQINTKIVEES